MESISDVFKGIFDIIMSIISSLSSQLFRLLKLLLWILAGIIILPCVYIAGDIYPKWTDWSEKL